MVLLTRDRIVPNLVRWVNPRNRPAAGRGQNGHVADFPTYPSGLRLSGRRVVVVGGGHVAQRRVPGLLIAVGADVHVVSPEVTPAIEGMVGPARSPGSLRGFEDADLDGAWYVIAATDDPDVNEAVAAAAEERRIFCVRADDATQATAWTPAVGRHAGVTVAVLGNREPQPLGRACATRSSRALREGTIAARHHATARPASCSSAAARAIPS